MWIASDAVLVAICNRRSSLLLLTKMARVWILTFSSIIRIQS